MTSWEAFQAGFIGKGHSRHFAEVSWTGLRIVVWGLFSFEWAEFARDWRLDATWRGISINIGWNGKHGEGEYCWWRGLKLVTFIITDETLEDCR